MYSTDLESARCGSAGAFRRLVEPLLPRLLGHATRLSGDTHLAEDLVQESLVAAWKSLHRFQEDRCELATWLHAILLNRYRKAVRRARVRSFLSFSEKPGDLPDSSEHPDAELADKEDHEAVRRAVAALPPRHREVVELRFFLDASLEEIAAATRVPLGTVKSRLHHAMQKLKKSDLSVNLSVLPGDKPIPTS